MIEYASKHYDKLWTAFLQHIELTLLTLAISIVLAAVLTILCILIPALSQLFIQLFSIIYSIPSLALFAILMPVTGLGMKTAVVVLVAYNQYLLLRNFMEGLMQVDDALIEVARAMGMNPLQILFKVRLPLSKKPLFAGLHLAVVSTISIGTIAASINAGGLGSVLLDGLRTMNVNKILWGSILSAGLAIVVNLILDRVEKRID